MSTSPAWMPLVEDLKQALAARDRDAARAAVTGLLSSKAQIGPQWKPISELMRVSGELTLAMRAMDAFVAAAAHSPQALYSKAVLLTQYDDRGDQFWMSALVRIAARVHPPPAVAMSQ